MDGIARLSLFALDCPDPRALATFYGAITGWTIDEGETEAVNGGAATPDDDEEDWVQLRSDGGATLAFQRAPDHKPPRWPSADQPQQAHLDFDVPDLDAGEQQVLALGARKAEVQPGTTFRVFLDPAGHPFCLVLAKD
jgi:predicted enzyme related to lactoylglutathione lyase